MCCRTLSGCRTIDSDQTALPKRCIRVTLPANSKDVQLRLEETNGGNGRYICLSHRWVQPQTEALSTTTQNYASRSSAIDFSSMPHNFQHVFLTAVRFGIQYVWIDSLCVIQGSAGDWEEESSKMGDYYQLAAFTVISTFPSNDSSYADYSPPKPFPLVRLPYRDSAGMQKGHFYVYPRASASQLGSVFEQHLKTSQLLTRGWIFQEWLLSRRIVCFTQSGVYMQCQCRNETVNNQLGDMAGSAALDYSAEAILSTKASLRLELRTAEDIYCGWEAVVEQYSSLTFSYPGKDRIKALLGVANEFARALGRTPCHQGIGSVEDGFMAGLWKGDLHRGLLWEQAAPGTHERLAKHPTWSWASVNTAIRWHSRHRVASLLLQTFDLPADDLPKVWWRCNAESQLVLVAATSTDTLDSSRVEDGMMSRTIQQQSQSHCLSSENPVSNLDVLHVRGCLQLVIVGEYLTGTSDTTINWDSSQEVGLSPSARRAVAVPESRSAISGWASLEHPEFQQQSAFTPNPMIYALLVSTPREWTERKAYLGFSEGCNVFNVLYLRRCEQIVDSFERLGMGKLFGFAAAKGFEISVLRDIKLI